MPTRLAGDVVCSRATAIFGPTCFTDQWHERDGAKILLVEIRRSLAGKLDERLITLFLTDRNNQTATDCESLFKCWGYLRASGRDQDRIKRRSTRPTACAIANAQLDI